MGRSHEIGFLHFTWLQKKLLEISESIIAQFYCCEEIFINFKTNRSFTTTILAIIFRNLQCFNTDPIDQNVK